MARRGPRVSGAELALLAALVAWGFFPVVLLLIHAADTGSTYTGADGLIGAHGVLGADQLQYLAWARDASAHGLASNLFTLAPSAHVYLEPVFGIIGGLDRLGVPLVVGSLAFKAVAAVALLAGAALWVRRLLPGRGARVAAIVLALFVSTPATALVNWLQTGSAPYRFAMYLVGDELTPATKLWGYLPAALAVALMPVALLALERALRADRRDPPALAAAAAAALLASWLHPWQGITLAIVVAALAVVRRAPREWPSLGVVLVAAAIPLAYYGVLEHADAAWRLAARYEDVARPSALVLLAAVGPLVAIAALGVRAPRGDAAEQMLLLWVPAGLIAYLANSAFAVHALEGLSIPFSVLAVRGGRRLRLPAAVGIAAVGLLTAPGLAYAARKFVRTADSSLVQYALPRSDASALSWVRAHGPSGGVLAPTPFAAVVPEMTGRRVWVGHGFWSPDYAARSAAADRLFDGRIASAPQASAFVTRTGARILVADCPAHPILARELAGLVASVHRFGCASVIVLRGR